jgi:hypothetical protein
VSDETWVVEELRATLFRVPSPSDYGTWTRLTGEPPANQSANPRTHTYHEDGPFLGGLLSVDVTLDRHDVRLSVLTEDPAQAATSSLGHLDVACNPFRELCERWVRGQPASWRRIALGVNARLHVPTPAAGYERLAKYLPAVRLSPNSSDFFYQINRRRTSNAVAGLSINRLSRWSVQRIQFASFAVGRVARPAIYGEPIHSCRAELDINTAAEHEGDLTADMVAALLPELQSLAGELLEVGDVE